MFGGGAEHLISNPMVAGIANQQFEKGREEIKKNLDKYISIGQLKYYFAVDTNYVGKKLGKATYYQIKENGYQICLIRNTKQFFHTRFLFFQVFFCFPLHKKTGR